MATRNNHAQAGLVTIVLPAKNEEAAIGRTLRSLPVSTLRAMGLRTEVFVLDGRSQDATAQIARDWGATVLQDSEPGKGSALRHARKEFRGDFVVMLDADGTYAPDAIPRVLLPLMRDEADVVMGDRLLQPGSMTAIHFLGNTILSVAAQVLYNQDCRDVCTGLWGFRRDALRALPLRSRRFGLEVEMFGLAARLGMRMTHVRVDYLRRAGQAQLSFGHDGLRIIRRLLRSRFLPLPSATPTATAARSPAPTTEVHA